MSRIRSALRDAVFGLYSSGRLSLPPLFGIRFYVLSFYEELDNAVSLISYRDCVTAGQLA
jgi:hypothetical protein